MTVPVRLRRSEIAAAMEVAKQFAGARLVLDFANSRIEIIVGEAAAAESGELWSDDDV